MPDPIPILALARNDVDTEDARTAADPAALARLYGPLVFRAAYRVLGDAARAEDVQQEVFLRLLEQPAPEVTSWPAWLGTCATRLAIDALRRQRRWARLVPLWLQQTPESAPSAEAGALDEERARHLRDGLARLSRREAQCFALRYLEGFDIARIAEVLSLSENNVSVTLHRARRRLEDRLGAAKESS